MGVVFKVAISYSFGSPPINDNAQAPSSFHGSGRMGHDRPQGPHPGFRLDRHGKPVRDERKLDVSARLKRKAGRKVRVIRRTAPR
jgi:hypothetical protein